MSAMPAPPSVLMIIVHYGGVNPTQRLLESLSRLDHFSSLDVLVVNNDSRDEVRSTLRSLVSPVSNIALVEPNENRGYFGGAKLAIDRYRIARSGWPAWLIISNNDVVIDDRLFLEKLMRRDPREVAVIAPRILSTVTQCDQNPFMRRRPGRLRIAELRFWLTNYYLARFHERLSLWKRALRRRMDSMSLNQTRRDAVMREIIYAPHGSFIIFSHKFFDRGGCIDDNFFLYAEEVSVAETCRRVGLPAVYEPELIVFHQEHSATGQKFTRTTYEHQKEALGYFADHYLTNFPNLLSEEP